MVKKREKLVQRVPGSVDFDMTEREYKDLTLENHVGVRVNVHVYEDSSGWHGWRNNDRTSPVVTWMRVIWWPVEPEPTKPPEPVYVGDCTEEIKPVPVEKLPVSSLYGNLTKEKFPETLRRIEKLAEEV